MVNPGAGQTTKPRPPEKVKQTQVLFVCGNFVESKQTNRRFYSRRFVITSCGSICFLLLCAWMCTRSCYLLGTFSDTNTDHVRTSCPNGDLIQDIMISEVLVRFRGKVWTGVMLKEGLGEKLVRVRVVCVCVCHDGILCSLRHLL